MKRPLVIFAILYIIGIILSSFLHIYIVPIITLIFSAVVIYILKPERNNIIIISISAAFFLLGFSQSFYFKFYYNSSFEQFNNGNVRITGTVAAPPEIKSDRIKYIVSTQKVSQKGIAKEIKGKLLVSVAKKDKTSAKKEALEYTTSRVVNEQEINDEKLPSYGDIVDIYGAVRIPSGDRNPGGFNYKVYLLGNGVDATMNVKPYNIIVKGSAATNPLIKVGLLIRGKVLKVINSTLPSEHASLLSGIMIGETSGLSDEVEEAFRDCGLTHIMAVSGANIAFVLLPFLSLFKKMRLSQRLSSILGIGVVTGFLFTVGFSPSVVRAAIMAYVYLFARIIIRDTDIYSSMAFAALIMLLPNPMGFYDAGFQLSFAGTLSLVMFYEPIKRVVNFLPGFAQDMTAACLAAQVGVTPISALFFNKVSIISLFANFVVLPIVEIVTTAGFLIAIIGQISIVAAGYLQGLNFVLLWLMIKTTEIGSKLPFSVIDVVTPTITFLIAYYFAVYMVLCKIIPKKKQENISAGTGKKYGVAVLVVITMAIIISIGQSLYIHRNLTVTFVDVGSGDCAHIRTPNGKNILIDGGGSQQGSSFDVGEDTVIPYLLNEGITHIDMVIVSHSHTDHVAGLIAVLKRLSVDRLVVNDYAGDGAELQQLKAIAENKGVEVIRLASGDRIAVDRNINIDVLSPDFEIINNNPFSKELMNRYVNNSSYVLKLIYKDVKLLFTGDIEDEAESYLIASGVDLSCDLMKVAHHGSAYSTSDSFIQAASPKAAVVSVGNNTHGHPDEKGTLYRLSQAGVNIYRTDNIGAIIAESDGRNIKVRGHMRQNSQE